MNGGLMPSPETLSLALFALVGLWFALLTLLWRRLIARHPAKYEAMNRPTFLSPFGMLSTLRFVVLREHRHLGDWPLGLMSDLALAVFVSYVVGFVSLASIAGASR